MKKPVFVKTKKWWGSVNLTRPILDDSYIANGVLRLSEKDAISESKEIYGDFEFHENFGVNADEMVFENRVKNSEEMGGSWAYDVSINLNGRKEYMTFNLLSPEAIVYANMIIAETKFETPSERMKLNNMGVDLSY